MQHRQAPDRRGWDLVYVGCIVNLYTHEGRIHPLHQVVYSDTSSIKDLIHSNPITSPSSPVFCTSSPFIHIAWTLHSGITAFNIPYPFPSHLPIKIIIKVKKNVNQKLKSFKMTSVQRKGLSVPHWLDYLIIFIIFVIFKRNYKISVQFRLINISS